MEQENSIQQGYATFEANSVSFAFTFVLMFMLTALSLSALELTPELKHENAITSSNANVVHAKAPPSAGSASASVDPNPVRIVIESVGIDVSVIEPESKDISVLDAALLDGAVHYPGSGNLTDNAAMFIFGHSSHLPSVNNKNFQAFNDLEDVKAGELVRVESTDTVNLYRATAVTLVSAQEALIPLGGSEKRLVLSTCNSFGKPSDRYVLEADFVASYALHGDQNIDK